jgi:hypothetical protein
MHTADRCPTCGTLPDKGDDLDLPLCLRPLTGWLDAVLPKTHEKLLKCRNDGGYFLDSGYLHFGAGGWDQYSTLVRLTPEEATAFLRAHPGGVVEPE